MKTNDHMMLGRYLMPSGTHRRGFLRGCVEPDYNILSYLRGTIVNAAFHGHDAVSVWGHIFRMEKRLENRGRHRAMDYFRLGCLIRYVADAFTFAHNPTFTGGLEGHVAYEKRLHPVMTRRLLAPQVSGGSFRGLHNARRDYLASAPSPENDAEWVLRACAGVFSEVVRQMERNCAVYTSMLSRA